MNAARKVKSSRIFSSEPPSLSLPYFEGLKDKGVYSAKVTREAKKRCGERDISLVRRKKRNDFIQTQMNRVRVLYWTFTSSKRQVVVLVVVLPTYLKAM